MASLNSQRETPDASESSDSTPDRECGHISHRNIADNNIMKRTGFKTGSFGQYLDNYDNKKFTSVKLRVPFQHDTTESELITKNVTDLLGKGRINNTVKVQMHDDFLDAPESSKLCVGINGKITSSLREKSTIVHNAPKPPPPPLPASRLKESNPIKSKCSAVEANLHKPCFASNWNDKVVVVNNATLLPSFSKIQLSQRLGEQNNKAEPNKIEKDEYRHSASSPQLNSNFDLNFKNSRDNLELKSKSNTTTYGPSPNSTTTIVPVRDNVTKITKSDPRVKKLVYNTYRNFLSAYNDKANEMVSASPRSIVQVDRGVLQQIESITLQGGLEKLNGRTNPKLEQE